MKSVLILDDDPALLKAMALYLGRSGYKVTQSTSPVLAIQQFKERRTEINLFITDLTMEGSSGIEIANQMTHLSSELRVIVMSGFPPEVWAERDSALFAKLSCDCVRTLQKPFSPMGLLQVIDELIGPGESLTAAAGC